ncbi:AraC family transcriptional regulator [Clostridium chromiireducens]|uniref:AraC family transcriptional regulator n=1 Tax=Clostridium chromiireducens TaxID=225345 RepID=A0A1V4IIV4_9CLOT|nr:AraC family transcriptional regulator [Clostridium chromiireducens]OPJ59427.1 HTH-type transcriptional activator Btr [Clostridium chromiireducens]RII34363.1 AraC family transcriptional regulator [Clostridium chromiireducens]
MSDFKSYIFNNINYVDIILYQFGSERCDSLHSFGPTVKNHYLFHYVLSGKGKLYSINDRTNKTSTYTIKAGEGFLLTPNIINTYEADKDDPWNYIWIEFEGLKAERYLTEIGISGKNPVYIPKEYNSENSIIDNFRFLLDNPSAPDSAILGHTYLLFYALLENSASNNMNKAATLQEFYVREAINYIEKNYDNNISVEDIAKWCNLDRSYFGKIFKSSMKTTPQEFLIKYRLSKACEMLKCNNASIKEIAELTGYPNQFYFSRAFKEVYAMSPRKWRNENKSF